MNKKTKLRYRAVLSLILSAVLFCMPAMAFSMNGNNAIDVRAEDSGESSTEEETESSTVVLKAEENVGMVQIADDVVAMIASLAATEVEGISAMAGNITNELMGKVGMKKLTKGVRVVVTGRNVRVDLAVTMEYGYNIPATCHHVQAKVKAAIENMTGLDVADVNIRITGVEMPEEN